MAVPLWQVILVAHSYNLGPKRTAQHFGWTLNRAQATLRDYKAFSAEVDRAIKDNHAMTETALKQMLSQLEMLAIPLSLIHPHIIEG